MSTITPNPHFDDWDMTPHAYLYTRIDRVELGDLVLGGTHQVAAFGVAQQRGADARRLDLTYVAGSSAEETARLILPTDHRLEVKRYLAGPHLWAYVLLDGAEDEGAALVPDFGFDALSCNHTDTMCDGCAGQWMTDHVVVRHDVEQPAVRARS